MTINNNVLTADAGKVLVKGDATATVVYLGINDSASNWTETDPPEDISADEALDIITGGADI